MIKCLTNHISFAQPSHSDLLRGTLDLLILRTLLLGPAHGHQIAKYIQRSTDDVLQVEHGSLYPALHRMERKGWLASKWESGEGKRELKYYRLRCREVIPVLCPSMDVR